MRTLGIVFLSGLSIGVSIGAAADPGFAAHEIATGLKGGYQVVVADVNGDGKPDLIALASGLPELYWYENPGWQRHTLAIGFNRMINCAFARVENKPVVVLASLFENDPAKSAGLVTVLTPGDDIYQPWNAREIDRLPTSHRIRVLPLNSRETVFLNVPLADPESHPPDYHGNVPVVIYRPGVWKREVIGTAEQGIVHGVWVEGPGRFLLASFLGIHRYSYSHGGFVRSPVAAGDPAPWPKSGSSDVAEGGSWIAAIEPWHGNQVVVYDSKGKHRQVLDDALVDGHTVVAVSRDAFLAGFRGRGTSVFLYRRDRQGRWVKSVLDDKMAAAACAVADLNGDQRPDIACIGTSTGNLKWYENIER